MNGIMITTFILSILMIWILMVTYHYAYNRKWGNENTSIDPLPDTEKPDNIGSAITEKESRDSGTNTIQQ